MITQNPIIVIIALIAINTIALMAAMGVAYGLLVRPAIILWHEQKAKHRPPAPDLKPIIREEIRNELIRRS